MTVDLGELWATHTLPAWCRVVSASREPVDFAVAPTDSVYDGDVWVDVRRRAADHTELPEIVLELDDVVVSSRGLAWRHGELIVGGSWGLRSGGALGDAPIEPRPAIELPGTHGSVVLQPTAFGHWLLHRLPRLHSLTQVASPPSMVSVELYYDDQPFFDCFGYSPSSVHRLNRSPSEAAHLEHMIVTTHLARPTGDRRIDPRRLDALVVDLDKRWNSALEGSDSPTHVYVTRRDRNDEREGCSNRDDLERFYQERGYTVVFPPDLSLPEQFAVFRRAHSVVGEMGSGMHWAMVCSPGTSVTYLTPRSGTKAEPYDPVHKSWMRAIADARGLHFGQIIANPNPKRQRWHADLERVSTAWASRPAAIAPH